MIPGRAAAAVPASLARILPRLWRCFLIHSLTPPLPGGCGGCGGAAPPPEPPVRARTIVEIVIPSAVRIDAIVIPCSRKRVRIAKGCVLMQDPVQGFTYTADLGPESLPGGRSGLKAGGPFILQFTQAFGNYVFSSLVRGLF